MKADSYAVRVEDAEGNTGRILFEKDWKQSRDHVISSSSMTV